MGNNKKSKQAKKKQQAQAAPPSNVNNDKEGGLHRPISVDIPSSPLNEKDGSKSSSPAPESAQESPKERAPETPVNPVAQAEKTKEAGNVAFKAKRFVEAIDLYTEAIGLDPNEAAYLTNRAAAYMALKRFRPALNDCQSAQTLQSAQPSAKTLIRLARCQLALGQPTPAFSTISTALSLEPDNAAAKALQRQVTELEGHLKNFEGARRRRDWGMARLALDRCLSGIEGEGGEIPIEWRLWRVELELARANWDAANTAANDAMRLAPNSPDVLTLRGLLLFLTNKLSQALQHVQSALRLDPGHEPAQRLRKRVKDVERLKEEGNNAFKSSRLQEATEKYSETLERIGESEDEGGGGQIRATLLSNRATTLLKLERHDDALADIEASLVLLPTSFKALRTRARLHLHFEKYESAVADFTSAIEQAGMDGANTDVQSLKSELKKAEAALKRSKTKDYYKILGIARDCTEIDIKKAYRRESLKHHPDKGGDEEKFKLVVEAHSVLSDPRRRERYDLGEDEDGMNDGMSGMSGGMGGVDISELFAQFHGGGMGGGFHSHSHGGGFGGSPFGMGGGARFSSGGRYGGQGRTSGGFSSFSGF